MSTFKIKKIVCSLIGHSMITTRDVTNHVKEYQCSCCGLELTNDLKGRKKFLTPELRDINEALINLRKRRHYSI